MKPKTISFIGLACFLPSLLFGQISMKYNSLKNPDESIFYSLVYSLDMLLKRKNNDIIHEFEHLDNNRLTLLQRQLIEKMNSGDRIVFMNIKIKGFDGLIRPINTWRLVIK